MSVRQPIPEHAIRVFEGVLFDVYQWEQELYDGSTTTFEKLKRKDSAVVIPVLPNGTLLIAHDEQPGREAAITFPGGQGDTGETPEETGRRELLEETGYEPGELVLWKTVQPSSKIEWAVHTFIARNCRKVAEPKVDAGERITLQEISLDEALSLADHPQFQSREIIIELIKARYDAGERKKLEVLLFPKGWG